MTRNPFQDIERMFDRMSRQLEGVEGDLLDASVPIDVEDTGEAFVVTADLPGFASDDIDVELTGETLTISGERVDEHESVDEDTPAGDSDELSRRYVRRERTQRSVSRSVRLPDAVDEDETTASYTNGVLTVTLPKISGNGGHHIPVE